jgi:hypothetical protein
MIRSSITLFQLYGKCGRRMRQGDRQWWMGKGLRAHLKSIPVICLGRLRKTTITWRPRFYTETFSSKSRPTGAHPSSYQRAPRGNSVEAKRPKCEGDHSLPSSAEVRISDNNGVDNGTADPEEWGAPNVQNTNIIVGSLRQDPVHVLR